MKLRSSLFSPDNAGQGGTASSGSTPAPSTSTPSSAPAANPFADSGSSDSGTPAAQRAEGSSHTAPVSSGSTATPPALVVAPTTGAAAPNQPPQSQTPPATQSPAPSVMTPEQMANIAAQTAARVVQQQQPAQQVQQPQLSQDEFRKVFNIPTVDANTFQAITGYAPEKPEQVQALDQFASGIIRAAVTMARFEIEQAREQFTQHVQPIIQSTKQQQDTALHQEFFTAHSHFKDFEPIINEVLHSLTREGAKFNDKSELFKAVADRATAWLGKAVQVPTAGQPAQQNNSNGVQPAANGSTRQMTPTSVGGQTTTTQSATGGSNANPGSLAKSLFG